MKIVYYFYDEVVKSKSILLEARTRQEAVNSLYKSVNEEFKERMGYGQEKFQIIAVGISGERGEFLPILPIGINKEMPDDYDNDVFENLFKKVEKNFDIKKPYFKNEEDYVGRYDKFIDDTNVYLQEINIRE